MAWNISIFYIKDDLNLRQRELIEKYWQPSKDKERAFEYLIKNLTVQFTDMLDNKNKKVTVTNYVSEMAYAISTDRKCEICGENIRYYDRALMQNQNRFIANLICKSCAQENAQITFQKIIKSLTHTVLELPKANYLVTNLSYIECIYLYIMFHFISDDGRITLPKVVVSEAHDEIVFNSLVNKTILAMYDDTYLDISRHLTEEFTKIRKYLPTDQQEIFDHTISQLPVPGLYFLNTSLTTSDQIKNQILQKLLSTTKLDYENVKEVESVVKSLLTYKAMCVFKSIQHQYRIKVSEDINLINTFDCLIFKYSPRRICHLLNFVAKEISAGLHSKKIKPTMQSSMYLKKLHDFISFLNEQSNPVHFYRDLPPKVRPALLEGFLCNFILEGILYLDSHTGHEIIKQWVENPMVKDNRLNQQLAVKY